MPLFGRGKQAPADPQPSKETEQKPLQGDDEDDSNIDGTPESPTIGVDAFTEEALDIKKRSVLAYLSGGTHRDIDDGTYPSNEQLVQVLLHSL